MRTTEAARTAFFDMFSDPTLGQRSGVSSFLENLNQLSPQLTPPVEPNVINDISYALLRPDLPHVDRKFYAGRSLERARGKVMDDLSLTGVVDLPQADNKARAILDSFIETTVTMATSYPAKMPAMTESQRTLMEVLNPNKKSREDAIVAANVLFNLFEPYLIDRLLALDVYHPENLRAQIRQLAVDGKLLKEFYENVEHVIELMVNVQSQLPEGEMRDRLFAVGPLFVKMLQTFAGKYSSAAMQNTQFVRELGKAFQEGIALPEGEDLESIKKELPGKVKYEEVVSGASVAIIIGVTGPNGEKLAVKIRRPGVEGDLAKNIRTYEVLAGILFSFFNEYAGNTPMAARIRMVEDALGFFLKLTENEVHDELDFAGEKAVQAKASEVLGRYTGLVIPKIVEGYVEKGKEDSQIIMERVDAQRIEDLPANPEYLKNITKFLIALWRNRHELDWHGNPTGGNIKGLEDGSIVIYDWGRHIQIPVGFVKNLGVYLLALARKDPKTLAKAYCRIQDPKSNQVTEKQVRTIAEEVFASGIDEVELSLAEFSETKLPPIVKRLINLQQKLSFPLVVRYQNVMDPRYMTFMKSLLEINEVLAKELDKPEYAGRSRKTVLARAAAKAAGEVIRKR